MSKSKKTVKKGKFKTKTKFIEFIGGKGVVNFLSNEAFIMGNQLSGLDMDGIKFKLTICDDMTVDLDEVDTNQTTKAQRARLVEIIEDKTIGYYRDRSVVQELDFTSTTKVKDKYVSLYLAVEKSKPIDKLASLLEEQIKMSEDAFDNLNELLNSWFEDEEFSKEIDEMVDEENSHVDQVSDLFIDDEFMQDHDNNINSLIEDSFQKMKEEKVNELKNNREKKEQELSKLEFQKITIDKNIEQSKEDLKLIENRIDDLQPFEDFNGYYFHVSERQNEKIILEPEIENIIKDKVSKIKSINLDGFMKLFTDGEFHIKLGKMVDDNIYIIDDYKNLTDEIWSKLSRLELQLNEDKLVYRGEMIWSQIVNKMIKMGFGESSDFNKLCEVKKEEISEI